VALAQRMWLSLGHNLYDVTHHFPSINSFQCPFKTTHYVKNQNIILKCVQWLLNINMLRGYIIVQLIIVGIFI